MTNHEMPVWIGDNASTRINIVDLDDGEILICFTSESVSTTARISLDSAEKLAVNIMMAVSSNQLKAAA